MKNRMINSTSRYLDYVFIKKKAGKLRVCFITLLLFLFSAIHAQQRPNIIVFLVDDMGWMDTSVPFGEKVMPLNKKYHTPNMERLAKQGMKFTNAYAAPVCTPSRVSLMTGMNAAHHRVTNYTDLTKNGIPDAKDEEIAQADWNYNGLSPVQGIPHTIYATPLPQLLKDAGYFTIHVGKAHWAPAGTPGSNPNNLGFVVNIAGTSAGHPQSFLAKENFGNIPGKTTLSAVPDLSPYYGTDTFLTQALTQEAIKAMSYPIKAKQPFYLHLAHFAVHTPIQADTRFVQKYYDAGLDSTEANYASLVEGMDKSLGDIMNFIAEKNLEKSTIILFMSDNGGFSISPYRGGKSNTQNLPLKSGKGSVCEGGIREPMLVKWPGVIKPSSVNNTPVIIEDFFPSILEMAGLKNYTTIQKLDGKSFVSSLSGAAKAGDDRPLIWYVPHTPNSVYINGGPGMNYFSAVRQGDWKLLYNIRSKQTELYNLKDDIGELNDLSGKYPDRVKKLGKLLGDKLRGWNATRLKYIASGKDVPFADEN